MHKGLTRFTALFLTLTLLTGVLCLDAVAVELVTPPVEAEEVNTAEGSVLQLAATAVELPSDSSEIPASEPAPAPEPTAPDASAPAEPTVEPDAPEVPEPAPVPAKPPVPAQNPGSESEAPPSSEAPETEEPDTQEPEGVVSVPLSEEASGSYPITLSEGGCAFFTLENPGEAEGQWTLSLAQADTPDTLLFTQEITLSSKEAQDSHRIGLHSGDYLLTVERTGETEADCALTFHFEASDSWEAEPNDHLKNATVVPVGKSISGTIMGIPGEDSDADYYKFLLSQPGSISVAFTSDNAAPETPWQCGIYTANGTTPVLENITFEGGDWAESTVSGLDAGTYYLKVWSGPSDGTPYQFILNYIESNAWEKENNDSPDLATPIVLGTTVSGSYKGSAFYDKDYYQLKLTSRTRLSCSLSHAKRDLSSEAWRVVLYNSNMQEVNSVTSDWDKGKTVGNELDLTAGVYYICVIDSNMSDASRGQRVYHLTVSKGKNTISTAKNNYILTASEDKAQAIDLNASALGGAAVRYESDSESITVSADGVVTVPRDCVGTAEITVSAAPCEGYRRASKTVTVTVKPLEQPMAVRKSTSVIQAEVLRSQPRTVKLTAVKAKGSVAYRVSNPRYMTVTQRGLLTLKKGTPKGIYRVMVTASGGGVYARGSQVISITVQ